MIQQKEWQNIFWEKGIPQVGVCDWKALPPLLPCRRVACLPEKVQSVMVAIFPYYVGEYPQRNISRYTLGRDYHHVVEELLKHCAEQLRIQYPQAQFAEFVDSSPIPEVAAGVLAGLGVVGRNHLLLHPQYGSYFFIGCIATDLPLAPTQGTGEGKCMGCGACIRSCPTSALTETGFCKEKCRSWITQKKGTLTPEQQQEIHKGGMVWGCDICNDVCPRNATPKLSPIKEMYENIQATVDHSNAEEAVAYKALGYRGIALIHRNIALVNGDDWI